MRIFILAVSLLISILTYSQDEKMFSSLDYKTVMNRLFDKMAFNAKQEALWKPNYAERINIPMSDDGFCYTKMDTTLYYNSGDTKQAIMIFATYEYQDGVKASCHACAPTLSLASFISEKDGVWHLVQFKKEFIQFGSWGKRLGQFGIEKFGEDFYCLKVQSAIDGNQGYERGVTCFYSLNEYEQFHDVFSYVYYNSNEGAMEEGKGFTEKTTMNTIPTNDFYVIELSSKRTGMNLYVKKKFNYSEDECRYLLSN